jgi:hypothetical protein
MFHNNCYQFYQFWSLLALAVKKESIFGVHNWLGGDNDGMKRGSAR